jgi:hypothetical protein
MTQDNAPSDPRTNYCVMILIHSDDARKTLDNPETVRRIVADALDTLQENHDNVPAKIEEEIDYTLDVYRTECDKDVTTYRIGKLEAENAALRQQVERLSAPVTDGVGRIAAERKRQIEQEGWTPEHDGEHRCGELARAACGYAALASYQAGPRNLVDDPLQPPILPRDWPWDVSWWKPSHDLIRNLVKAGALIAAEIDRLAARKGAA